MDDGNKEYNRVHAHLNDGTIDVKKLNMSQFSEKQRAHILLHLRHFGMFHNLITI